jgi:hypothetical protein
MQCTVHTGNSLGIGIIEKFVGRYWMFNIRRTSTSTTTWYKYRVTQQMRILIAIHPLPCLHPE